MPKARRFKARASLAQCHYHAARVVVLGATFSVWASLGSLSAAPGVVSAWVLALVMAILLSKRPWRYLSKRFGTDAEGTRLQTAISVILFGTDADGALGQKAISVILFLILFCPLLSASANLPLSALFILVVQLSYFVGRLVLAHIGTSEDSGEQVWVACRRDLWVGAAKWTDAPAGPTIPAVVAPIDVHLLAPGRRARSVAGRGSCLHEL